MKLTDILASVEETDELVIGTGVINDCSFYLKKYWGNSRPMIVADSNTWHAAGELLSNKLKTEGFAMIEPLVFQTPPYLHADYENVELIIKKAALIENVVLIAAGSGTINDLVKRASFELAKPYLCVGTAASMDGYCSSGAALSKNGRKQTMECDAPKVIIADTDILKTAPPEASSAGFGDLASKLTAGADWIIADFTGDEPIDEKTWSIVQPNLERWLRSPEKLAAGDQQVLSAVFEGLNYSGLAMQVLGRSRAASGAEHLFSHIWEMSGHLGADGNPVSHGFQVSVGILCVTALMEEVFALDADDIDIDEAIEAYPDWEERTAEIKELMEGLPSWTEYLDICREKFLNKEQLKEKLIKIKTGWNELKQAVWKKLPHYQEMKQLLKDAGCPVTPQDINLEPSEALSAYRKAQCMRNRYTVLDLAYELGIFSKCIDNIKNSRQYLK